MPWSFHLPPMQPLADVAKNVHCFACDWIPVSERLPEHTNTVIVCDADGVWFANRENKLEGWYDTCGGGMMENVTHWMPLPEPPQQP